MMIDDEAVKALSKHGHVQGADHARLLPTPLLHGLLTLTAPEDVRASVVVSSQDRHGWSHETAWKALWLTPAALSYAEGRKAVAGWHLGADEEHLDFEDLRCWSAPLTTITRLDVKAKWVDRWAWAPEVRFSLDVYPSFELPLTAGRAVADQERVDTFLTELRKFWPAR